MMDLSQMSQRQAPRRLRAASLRQLCECTGASVAFFCTLDEQGDTLHFGEMTVVARESVKELVEAWSGAQMPRGSFGSGTLTGRSDVLDCHKDRFARSTEEFQDRARLEHTEWYAHIMAPLDARGMLRMYVCNDEGLLIGLVCALAPKPFDVTETARANAVRDDIREAVMLADMFERPDAPQERLFALFAKDGELMFSSPAAARWFDSARRETCKRLAHNLVESGDARGQSAIDGARLTMEILEGDGLRVLFVIEAQKAPRLGLLHTLSATQRQIAEFAAIGASNTEIAQLVGASSDTIEGHLRRIYHTLGVKDRRGLVRSLKEI